MNKIIYSYYDCLPPKVNHIVEDDTCFVSQSEVQNSSLSYMMSRFGMDTLTARLEEMRGKFGYADCTVNNNFADLQNKYVSAVNYFNNLPSELRRKYQDSPEVFYDSISKDPVLAHDNGFISDEVFESIMKESYKDDVKSDKVDLTAVPQSNNMENSIMSDTKNDDKVS